MPKYQNVFTLPRHATGASSNCSIKLYVSRSWAASLWNRKITSRCSKNEKLAQKEYERMYSNAIWCQTTIGRGRKYTRKIVSLSFSISEKFELPGLSSRPNHTHFPLGMKCNKTCKYHQHPLMKKKLLGRLFGIENHIDHGIHANLPKFP